MNVVFAGSSRVVKFMTNLPKAAHDEAHRRIATTLRSDVEFMAELKLRGLYDDDAAAVIDDSEVLEG